MSRFLHRVLLVSSLSVASAVAGLPQHARAGSCTLGWSPTSGAVPGTNDDVVGLTAFDDGGGAALYAGGSFASAGGVAASRISRWDGASWSPLGSGTDGIVLALAVFDDGGGPALYAGGRFTAAGSAPASRVARWGCGIDPFPAFCDAGDGSLVACPCANPGDAASGCDNAQATGGVSLAVLAQTTSTNAATISGTGFSTMG